MAWYRCGGIPSSVLSLPTPSEASGAIARFNTDLTENLLSAVAEFSASQAEGTQTPSTPIPIVGVDKVEITRTQNNIFTSPIERGNINAYGEDTDNLNPNRSRTAKQIAVSPSTEYTVGNAENYQVGLFFYASDGTFISYLSWDNTPRTFTTPSDCAFVRFSYQNTSNTFPTKNQLCKGATLDDYDQTVKTVLINLGGTYYGGEVDAVTGKITLTHKKYVIDENSDITWRTSSNTATFDVDAYTKYRYGGDLLLCDTLQAVNVAGLDALLDNQIGMLNNSGDTTYSRIPFKVENITSKADMQTWLASHNITIVVNLATPLIVYASNTAEIPTLNGDNQVFADSGNIAVKFFETVGHKI